MLSSPLWGWQPFFLQYLIIDLHCWFSLLIVCVILCTTDKRGVKTMFKHRTADGKRNLCGQTIQRLRKQHHHSQRALADAMQLKGVDVSKYAVGAIEAGKRFVTDMDLVAISSIYGVSIDALVDTSRL